jgi:hypothetical protein
MIGFSTDFLESSDGFTAATEHEKVIAHKSTKIILSSSIRPSKIEDFGVLYGRLRFDILSRPRRASLFDL